jgi:hypothetical protein
LNKDVVKWLTAFEIKKFKNNENWRLRLNNELMQLFGDLDVLPFVRMSRLNWIGHVNG